METRDSRQENLVKKFCSEWPWQSSPESWVSYLLEWIIESDVYPIYLNPSANGGILTFRWDGLVLKGPTFSVEQYEALLAAIRSHGRTLSSIDAALESTIIWQEDKVFHVAWLQTFKGIALAIQLQTASLIPNTLHGLPIQAREVIEKMRQHPNGLMVFNHRGYSTQGGLMFRVFNTMHSQQSSGRFACVTESLNTLPLQDDIISIEVTNAPESWERALRALVAQDVDVYALSGRDEQETTAQAVLTALEDRAVLVSVSFPLVVDTLLWLHSELRVDAALVAQVLLGVVGAYKGFKKVCSHCREEYQPEKSSLTILKEQGIELSPDDKWMRGRGCEQCHQSGYKPSQERVSEAIYIDRELAQLCAARPSREALVRALSERDFRSYLEQMMDYARQGDATLEEVIRIGMARKADL